MTAPNEFETSRLQPHARAFGRNDLKRARDLPDTSAEPAQRPLREDAATGALGSRSEGV
jgi:hypothetical protein